MKGQTLGKPKRNRRKPNFDRKSTRLLDKFRSLLDAAGPTVRGVRLEILILRLRRDLFGAGKKVNFFEDQYMKFKGNNPQMARLHKRLMQYERKRLWLLQYQVKKAQDLQRQLTGKNY